MKVAAAVAVIGAVFAEWAGSDRGLGHTLLLANGQLETARAFAATVLLFALAIVLYGAVRPARAARRELEDRTVVRPCPSTPAAPPLALARRGLRREARARPGRDRERPSRCGSCSTTSPTPTTPASTPRRPTGEYRKAGLDVDIKAPPDPAAPLKLLQAGRADVVISYEPELLLARDKGADDLVAVGALVQKPLTSLIALPASKINEREGPRGQARRHRRHRLPDAPT